MLEAMSLTPELTIVVHLLLTAVSVLVVGKLLPGVTVKSFAHAVLFACVVAVINALAWGKLGAIRGVPQLVSGGVGSLLLTTLVFYTAGKVAPGVEVSGCVTAGLGALAVSFLNGVLYATLREFLR